MKRSYNFYAGPAALPEPVLKIAQQEMLNWRDTGMSVMEISHRSSYFEQLRDETESLLRQLMNIPNNYQVLFLPGGARTQFAMLPMNLLAKNSRANYLVTGTWSESAYLEAQKYGDITLAATAKMQDYRDIPAPSSWQLDSQATYCYYTPNETIHGVEFDYVPSVTMPLVADMTSCILSQEYDVTKFGVIFAAAQKNLGQAGITMVIIRDDLIQEPMSFTPAMLDYRKHRDYHSFYNTAPTYAIYIMNLVLRDLVDKGGVGAIAKINQQKAYRLYNFIDNSDFYYNQINPTVRSKMNVTFHAPNEALEKKLLAQTAAAHIYGLKGHSSVGGLRASLYNAVSIQDVEYLINFLTDFAQENH